MSVCSGSSDSSLFFGSSFFGFAAGGGGAVSVGGGVEAVSVDGSVVVVSAGAGAVSAGGWYPVGCEREGVAVLAGVERVTGGRYVLLLPVIADGGVPYGSTGSEPAMVPPAGWVVVTAFGFREKAVVVSAFVPVIGTTVSPGPWIVEVTPGAEPSCTVSNWACSAAVRFSLPPHAASATTTVNEQISLLIIRFNYE